MAHLFIIASCKSNAIGAFLYSYYFPNMLYIVVSYHCDHTIYKGIV